MRIAYKFKGSRLEVLLKKKLILKTLESFHKNTRGAALF